MMKAMAVGFSPSKVQTGWFAFQSEYARKHRYWPLKIVKKVFETKDSCSFHLEVPSEAKGEFRYKAGQFITLRLLDKGQLHKRSYSLSSCPLEDDILRFTVKRIPGGMISNDIIDTSHVGDELLVYPPAGNFTPAKGAEQYFFLTGGSGITPCMSLIRYLLKRPSIQTISLLFSNHNAESIIFEKELELLAKRFPGKLQVVHHLSGPSSRLTKEAILAKLPRDREALHCYICGPTGLMQLGKEAFQSHGVDPSRIHQETFASLSEPFEGIKQKPSENTVVGSGETADPETVTVSLWGDTVTIPIQKGQNILSAALDEGLSPPYSCREGICGTCIAKLECGKVSMEKTTALSDKEIEEGMILTCQAIPQTEKTTVKY